MSDITMTVQVDKAMLEQLMQPGEIERRLEPIVAKYAYAIEGNAKDHAPVLTGFLKNSLQSEPQKGGNWTVSDGTEYGLFQELGTRFMAGKFFLTGACEALADRFFDALTEALQK